MINYVRLCAIVVILGLASCSSELTVRLQSTGETLFESPPTLYASQLYNYGIGTSLPGAPDGDSVIAYGPYGREPNGEFTPSIIPGRHSPRNFRGNEKIVCLRADSPSQDNNNYIVWRPTTISTTTNRISFTMQLSSESRMRADLIFAKHSSGFNSGFRKQISKHAMLSIRNGSILALATDADYETHSTIDRLGEFSTPPPRRGTVDTNLMVVSFDKTNNVCKVVVTESGIDAELDREFCDLADLDTPALGIQVYSTTPTTAGGLFPFFCHDTVAVISS